MKFHFYSLKVSANIKIAMQSFETFGWGCPKCPPWLRACHGQPNREPDKNRITGRNED